MKTFDRQTFDQIFEKQWRDCANFVLGLWLFSSPWVLNHLELEFAAWNAWALGVVIAISALAALVRFHAWEEWVSAVFGAWLLASPWLLGYSNSAATTWNHFLVGLLVLAMACWSLWVQYHPPRRTA